MTKHHIPVPTHPDSDWLTINDTAARAGVSANTARQWAKRGRVTSARTRYGQRLVLWSSVRDWLKSREELTEAR